MSRGLRAAIGAVWLSALCAGGPAQAAEYSCPKSGAAARVLSLRGEITGEEYQRFATAFGECYTRDYKGPVTIDLLSGGGRVDQALRISNALIAYGRSSGRVTTRVSRGGVCISACTYLFVAGNFREVSFGGSLEPHGFSGFLGDRIDEAIADVVKRKDYSADKSDIQRARLRFMLLVLSKLADTDGRFAWLNRMGEGYVNSWTDAGSIEPVVAAYAQCTADQRELLATLDSVTQLVLTEAERASALKAFHLHLDPIDGRGGATDVAAGLGDDTRFRRWMVTEYLQALNGYLAATHGGARLANLDLIQPDIETQLDRAARSTTDTVNEELWPYLATRKDDVDLDGFIKLMFSTSILYTRPLTREELCDFNLVNRDCNQ